MAANKKVTLYIYKVTDAFAVYTEDELGEEIANGNFEDGAPFWEVTIEGKPKKLNVGEWSLE